MGEPWERQTGESSKAYRAFCIYRDLGPKRSLRRTAGVYYNEKPGVNLGRIKLWSSKYHWVARCEAWDDYQDELARERQTQEIQEMRERHARQGKVLADLSSAMIAEYGRRVQKWGGFDRLKDEDVKSLLHWATGAQKVGHHEERLARGEPTEHTVQEITGSLERVVDELSAFPSDIRSEILRHIKAAEQLAQSHDRAEA